MARVTVYDLTDDEAAELQRRADAAETSASTEARKLIRQALRAESR